MRWPLVALVGCLVAAAVVVLLTVPFPVLAGAHPHVDVLRDFTRQQLAREDAYHRALRPPAYASLLVGLVLLGVLGLTGLGARLVGGLPGHWTVKAIGATALVFALARVVTLAFDVQGERVLRRYGLSTQSWRGWTDDLLRGFGIQVAMTSLVVVVVLALARKAPGTWWAWRCSPSAGRSSTRWWSSRRSTASPRCRPGSCAPTC
jgi:STE24 endopeptidase